jgi:hypothetical protein
MKCSSHETSDEESGLEEALGSGTFKFFRPWNMIQFQIPFMPARREAKRIDEC